MSSGVSPFKAKYGFNPSYGGIPSDEQCTPEVATRMQILHEVQEELKLCLEKAQELMTRYFDQHVKETPNWNIGDKVWLSSKHIPTTRPSPKMWALRLYYVLGRDNGDPSWIPILESTLPDLSYQDQTPDPSSSPKDTHNTLPILLYPMDFHGSKAGVVSS
ncbi:hypothetical protein PSTG_06038 [Puccinia striiformis f. sp. tritici PST-78]|uniref:Uncharacterized protein n=1 Tax=Puccinia striiformis f. sp. tritici PST-78 TaxID=1165861 RepID=A0A0L0VMW5_9BASI|nr:hypothetical protein PSTG_06038 [Puccinia striiformis f. sp. tritici PST-78]